MREHYPEAEESIDDQLPKPFFDELAITAYIDKTGHCGDFHLWDGISCNEDCCRGSDSSEVYASKPGHEGQLANKDPG
eukprot:10880920-Ditylum_brightwellii.AAC.1